VCDLLDLLICAKFQNEIFRCCDLQGERIYYFLLILAAVAVMTTVSETSCVLEEHTVHLYLRTVGSCAVPVSRVTS